MMMLVLKQLVELLGNSSGTFHSIKHLRSGQLIPIGAYNSCRFVVLTNKLYSLVELFLAHLTRMAEYDTSRMLYLIVKELTKVLHIHLTFSGINNNCATVKLYVVIFNRVNRLHNVAELSNSRRLDKHSVGVIFAYNFAKRITKISNKRTTDAA